MTSRESRTSPPCAHPTSPTATRPSSLARATSRRSRAVRDDASDGRRPSRSELGARGRVDDVRWMVSRSETLATKHARWVRRPRRALVRDVELFSRARTASDLSRASDSVAEVVERVRRERAEGDVNARRANAKATATSVIYTNYVVSRDVMISIVNRARGARGGGGGERDAVSGGRVTARWRRRPCCLRRTCLVPCTRDSTRSRPTRWTTSF